MNHDLLCGIVFAILGTLANGAVGAPETIPFPKALADADIRLDRLDRIVDDALIVGNGDINALVYTSGRTVMLNLTKNDVWDARLETLNDPPFPTWDLIKQLGKSDAFPLRNNNSAYVLPKGMTWERKDSYHVNPYPCPRQCARIAIGEKPSLSSWTESRAQGKTNEWVLDGEAGTMRVKGAANQSAGYAYGPLSLSTDLYKRLRIRVSGTANAQYTVDVLDNWGQNLFKTGWIDSPAEPSEKVCELPSGTRVSKIILYTQTKDGALAENRFTHAALEGTLEPLPLDMQSVPKVRGELDLRRGVLTVQGKPDGPPAVKVRALADRNVFLIEAEGPLSLMPVSSEGLPEVESGNDGTVSWIKQSIPGDLDWPGMEFAVAVVGKGKKRLAAIVSSLESDDVVRAAVGLVNEALQTPTRNLVKTHEAEWERFWAQSGVEMDDESLQRTWYRSLYFLRCVSKPGVQSVGLFAGLISDTPAWHGDYHTNYNIQQTYWGAYPANHPELAEPYDRLMYEYLPRAEWLCKQVFDMDGAYYPHVLYAYEPTDLSAVKSVNGRQYIHHAWGMTVGVNGFTVQPLWWRYKYDPDPERLKNVVYPALRATGIFYAEFIEACEGEETVRLGPSVSPEHWGWTKNLDRNYNCAFDIALARYTLDAAIEAAKTLGQDEALVKRFERAKKRLPPYPLYGGERPIVVDVEDAPPQTYNISVPATPVFPGDVVTWWSSEEEKELFIRTIDGLKWNGNNSTVMLAVSRARLSMSGTQEWLRTEVDARTRPNGTMALNRLVPYARFNDFGHYTEQFGIGMAVCELLAQSVGDILRLFPAVEPGCRARFARLRAQGGFLISGETAGKGIGALTMTSLYGKTFRMLSPWAKVEARRDSESGFKPLALNAEGILTVTTEPNETWHIRGAR